jgi:hypothetical protein
MAQIFHRSTNTISKVSIFGAVFAVAGLLGLFDKINRSPWVTEVNVAREQVNVEDAEVREISVEDAKDYINLKEDGPHTPGLAKESSILLAKERDVLGVGVETVGTDAGQAATFDPPFPNHYLMHGSGKFGLASLCNLDQLPPTGAIVIAAPLKIVGGSGSPLRVIAIAP